MLLIKDLMTKEAVSVKPETTLAEITQILSSHGFNGVPVVDKTNVLVGLITEYNLISGPSGVHLPTLQKLLGEIPVLNKDKKEFNNDVAAVMKMTARDVMNKDPFTLPTTATYEEAVKAFQDHHAVNPIPIIDPQRKLTGVVSRFDILKTLLRT